jgi:hypothetical protein
MSTLTPSMLSTQSSTITALLHPHDSGPFIMETGDMRREYSPIPNLVTSLSTHVSIRFFSIANWS